MIFLGEIESFLMKFGKMQVSYITYIIQRVLFKFKNSTSYHHGAIF